jgi:predicted Zn-dependent peptidase
VTSDEIGKPSLLRREKGGLRDTLKAVCVALLVSGAAFAEERRLSNGVRVVVEARPATETVAIRLVIGGGVLDDPPGKAGLARLHAALLLRGTARKSGFELARAAEELGGRLAASSRPLAEIISITVPAESAEPALRLVAEMLQTPRLEPADLAKEKDLLAGEIATERDQPSTARSDAVYRALFPDHPLSRLALPSEKEIRGITIDDIRAFQRARLTGGRLALLVVGSCDPPRVEALARELLSAPPGTDSSASELVRPSFSLPRPLTADVSERVSQRTTQAELTVALPTAGLADPDRPAFALLSHVLGGFQERLYQEIREKHGWAYSVDAGGEIFPGAGLFEVTTGAEKEHLDDIERVVREELARIASAPVSAEELRRAVAYLKTAEARRDETNAGRAAVLADELLAGSPLRNYQERIARLQSVRPEEIQALARRLFAGRHFAVVKMY